MTTLDPDAVTEGVRQALCDIMEGLLPVTRNDILDAIQEGMRKAVYDMDFSDAVAEGARKAVEDYIVANGLP